MALDRTTAVRVEHDIKSNNNCEISSKAVATYITAVTAVARMTPLKRENRI
jgi:hypothetical protein